MRKEKPWTVINSFIQPDGTKLVMSKIENAGTPERIDTIYITEEEHQAFNDKTMENVSRLMSPYYNEEGVFSACGWD